MSCFGTWGLGDRTVCTVDRKAGNPGSIFGRDQVPNWHLMNSGLNCFPLLNVYTAVHRPNWTGLGLSDLMERKHGAVGPSVNKLTNRTMLRVFIGYPR